jgi:hypothetical protein
VKGSATADPVGGADVVVDPEVGVPLVVADALVVPVAAVDAPPVALVVPLALLPVLLPPPPQAAVMTLTATIANTPVRPFT